LSFDFVLIQTQSLLYYWHVDKLITLLYQ